MPTQSSTEQAGVFESARRVIATALAIGETRLRLLGLDLQDQSSRFISILVFALAAAALFVLGVMASVLLVVLILWDTHRLLAVGFVLLAFFGTALLSAMICVYRLKTRPRFFDGSLTELQKDLKELGAA